MIRRLVDFALENRFLVLAAAILLFAWGIVSFYRLPVEAYPDVANNYVDVIAQWPEIPPADRATGHHPAETVMNGIPGVAHVRSWSIFGPSTVEMVFGKETTDFENRERVLERLSPGNLLQVSLDRWGRDWSPVPDLLLHSAEHEPRIRPDELKTLEPGLSKNWKSIGFPDTVPFGGPSREYQSAWNRTNRLRRAQHRR